MSHHGWVGVTAADLSKSLQSPFGRLFPMRTHEYNSHAISLLSGALGPIQTVTEPGPDGKPVPVSVLASRTKRPIPAGFTFFGQFVDHDSTEFRVVDPALGLVLVNPTIEQRQRVLEDGRPTTTNGRTGRLDLDSVYGLLGTPDLRLFDADGRFRMRELDGRPVDIERNVDYRDGRRIADPRNDENKIIVQLHVLFERLHNHLHNDPAGTGADARVAAITATRKRVVAIYRRIVLFDYLSKIVDRPSVVAVGAQLAAGSSFYQKMNRTARTALTPLLDQVLAGIPLRSGEDPDPAARGAAILADLVAMPVEFAHAAFRLGHSQLRDRYRLNDTTGLPLFVTGQIPSDTRDLRGNSRIDDDLVIEWLKFFGPDDTVTQQGEPLDASLPASVFRLPPPAVDAPPVSLAERNIRRGVDFGLPSGQEVARTLDGVYHDVPALTADEVLPPALVAQYPEIGSLDPTLAVSTPLWFYILQESAVQPGAATTTHLGKAGGYIVAETVLGSLDVSTDFDLRSELVDYDQKVTAAEARSNADTPDEICTMRQLLAFLKEPGF